MSEVRNKVIAGNWKMNCSREQAVQLGNEIIQSSSAEQSAEMIICVPSIHLADISELTFDSAVKLGAQNAHWEQKGAYTGEISVEMLKDYAVDYLLIGHSERRDIFGESNEMVAKKFAAALKAGIEPILCIGESLEQREQGITLDVLKAQVSAVIDLVGINAFSNAKIAYEPIWAIGTGKTATPEQAQQVHQQLREWLASFSAEIAEKIQILYGGSMNATNANELLSQPDIDGGLIGGASLKAADFLKIYSFAG